MAEGHPSEDLQARVEAACNDLQMEADMEDDEELGEEDSHSLLCMRRVGLYRELIAKIEQQQAALVLSVSTIQTWHNMEVPVKQRSELWDLYWRNAPEMKLIREVISNG